jgi:hypothetical protein
MFGKMRKNGRKRLTYNKFNNINGGTIGTESRYANIETMSKKLFSFFLAQWWEIRIHTGSAMHSNCPTNHIVFALSFLLVSLSVKE